MGEKRKSEGKEPLVRTSSRWKDTIKIHVKNNI
jgi:hypothetical protein